MGVESSSAFENEFFALCRAKTLPKDLDSFVRNWFAVTQAFSLGALEYLGVVAKLRRTAPPPEWPRLEEALTIAIDIGAGEFGFGRQGRLGIHFNLFARLAEPLGFSCDDLHVCPRGTVPETAALVDWFSEAFLSPFSGAGVLRVVERTAFKIVQAMDVLFTSQVVGARSVRWSKEQRRYIDLHLTLEPQHARVVEELVKQLSLGQLQKAEIEESTARTCTLFGRFWLRMSDEVFGRTLDMAEAVSDAKC